MEVLLEGAGGELAGGGRGLGACTQAASQLRPGTTDYNIRQLRTRTRSGACQCHLETLRELQTGLEVGSYQ